MYADLHLHSYYSDGSDSVMEIVAKAAINNVSLISICDHNNTAAYLDIVKACKIYNVSYIRGVEIDCDFNGVSLDILAYDYSYTKELLSLLTLNRKALDYMSIDLIEKMQADYPEISMREYLRFRRKKSLGGWKGINYLAKKGFLTSYPECMKYYRDYKIVRRYEASKASDVIDIIHRAKGKAVLAHAGGRLSANPSVMMSQITELYEMGIDGIECYYPSHGQALCEMLVDFCEKKDLMITAGSDDHGKFARVINGVSYDLEKNKVDIKKLNLKDVKINSI